MDIEKLKSTTKILNVLKKEYEDTKNLIAKELENDEIERADKSFENLKRLKASIEEVEKEREKTKTMKLETCIGDEEEYVYTASGELCEYTFGTFKEAYVHLKETDAWGVVLKHKPSDFGDEEHEEILVFEHLPHLKP